MRFFDADTSIAFTGEAGRSSTDNPVSLGKLLTRRNCGVVLLYHAFLLSRKLRQLAAGHRNEPAKSWLFRFASLSFVAVTRRQPAGRA